MIKVEFNFNQAITVIQATLQDPFQDIIKSYLQKTQLESGSVSFIANGKVLNQEGTLENKMNPLNKENKILKILVNLINPSKPEQNLIKSKDIICPKCYEPCRIKIENYRFKLYDCVNNHIIDNIKINDFQNTQMINMKDIICEIHKDKNMANSYKNKFYKCLTCKRNICLLCKENHDKTHNIIKYELKNYICPIHNSLFIKYCTQCKLNLCILCNKEHKDHNKILFDDNSQIIDEIKDNFKETKKILESFSNNIETIILKLTELNEIVGLYYEMNNDIINNYDIRNTNYNIFENIKELNNNNELYKELKEINKIKNLNDKFKAINNLYDKINLKKENINVICEKKSESNDNINIDYKSNNNIICSNSNDKNDIKLLKIFNKNYNLDIKDINIVELYLWNNNIGFKGFKDLCKINLKELKELYLSGNNIRDITEIEK